MTDNFGSYHRQLREEAGYGLRQFAQLIAQKPSTLSAIECGNRKPFGADVLLRSAEALGLSKGTAAWNEFFDLACAKGSVPSDVLEITENELFPTLLRTLDEAQLTEGQLRKLLEHIRTERSISTNDC